MGSPGASCRLKCSSMTLGDVNGYRLKFFEQATQVVEISVNYSINVIFQNRQSDSYIKWGIEFFSQIKLKCLELQGLLA